MVALCTPAACVISQGSVQWRRRAGIQVVGQAERERGRSGCATPKCNPTEREQTLTSGTPVLIQQGLCAEIDVFCHGVQRCLGVHRRSWSFPSLADDLLADFGVPHWLPQLPPEFHSRHPRPLLSTFDSHQPEHSWESDQICRGGNPIESVCPPGSKPEARKVSPVCHHSVAPFKAACHGACKHHRDARPALCRRVDV